MMDIIEEANQPELTDQDIDQLVDSALADLNIRRAEDSTRPGRGLWYLGIFLLGMTFMEGLRLLEPVSFTPAQVIYRCGGHASNPAATPFVGPAEQARPPDPI